jgi:predicted amidohydrolase YtcJ
VNSLALCLAGIEGQTLDPAGGQIEKDESTDQPTGILRENAMDLFHEHVPVPDRAARQWVLRRVVQRWLQLGLTGVHDCGLDGAQSLSDFQELLAAGELKMRILWTIPTERLQEALRLGLRSGFGNDYVRVGHVKLFADGSLRSQSAEMLAPLEGRPENRGIAVTGQRELEDLVRYASEGGTSCAIHAIGDRANRRTLDAIAR